MGNIVFAQSGSKQIAINIDLFVNATYRHRRTEEALTLNLGDVGDIKRARTLNMPEAREAFLALRKYSDEPGSQLFYMAGENVEIVFNLGKLIAAVYAPDNPDGKRDLYIELFAGSMELDGSEAKRFMNQMEAYSQVEKV